MAADRLALSDLSEFEREHYAELLAEWQLQRSKLEKALRFENIEIFKLAAHAFAGDSTAGTVAGKIGGAFQAARRLHRAATELTEYMNMELWNSGEDEFDKASFPHYPFPDWSWSDPSTWQKALH